ncbi:MAG: cystathionine beta-lyase [Pseudomonadota bacterium]
MNDDGSRTNARALRRATQIVHAGLDPDAFHGFVNPPVVHASTVLFPDVQATIDRTQRYTYGLSGTPTTDALEAVIDALEGSERTVLVPSGLAACTLPLSAMSKAGDRVVVVDNIYWPTRRFCDGPLAQAGVTTTYVDPLDLEAFAAAAEGAAAVFLEAPGSQTFEMPDISKMAEIARAAGAISIMDNTWATPVFFQPLAHGVDLSVQACTKYYAGHSDVLLGAISGNGAPIAKVRQAFLDWGWHVAPDDVFLTLRGIRTLDVRLERAQRNARIVAEWLSARPDVHRVLYPALPDAPGHAIWARDFSGATGLFAITFKGCEEMAVRRFIEGLALFGIGYSWGGFESLVTPCPVQKLRTATRWPDDEHVVRLHIGLEDPADLIADLEASLTAAHLTGGP